MSESERRRWDERYATGDYQPRTWSTQFLEQWASQFKTGRALVIACGTGRNALYLAEQGFDVVGVDISTVALEKARAEAVARGLSVEFWNEDLDAIDLRAETFDVITVIRYRNTQLWPKLIGALRPNAWVLVEHHLKTSAAVAGPSTDEFRLDPGELLTAFAGLRIVHYSEQIEPSDDSSTEYAIARLVACNGDPGW